MTNSGKKQGGSTSSASVSRSSSRKDILLNSAIFFLLAVGIVVLRVPIFGNSLYAPRHTKTFGQVNSGSVVRQEFTVYNPHPWSVIVTGAQGGCGCTKAFPGKEVPFTLGSFQSMTVTVALDTEAKKGYVHQQVFVSTNENPQGATLTLSGDVSSEERKSVL